MTNPKTEVSCGVKIIAKVKDYYDYLQGIYGVDERIVYDRREGLPLDWYNKKNGSTYYIFINGKSYCAVYYDGRFRYDAKIIEKAYREYLNTGKAAGGWSYSLESQLGYIDFRKDKNFSRRVEMLTRVGSSNINSTLREPVLISCEEYPKEEYEVWAPLTLKEFDFGSRLGPHDVYIEISNFLSWCVDNPPIPDKQTDKEKVVSHGFDLKTSFRHRK